MIDNIKKILEKKFIQILEHTPSACIVLVDKIGHWDISDFEIVWFNASAKRMLGKIISGGKVTTGSSKTQDEFVEHLQLLRQQVLEGRDGFIGPFVSAITDDQGQAIQITRYAMYLGEAEPGLPTFLSIAHSNRAD